MNRCEQITIVRNPDLPWVLMVQTSPARPASGFSTRYIAAKSAEWHARAFFPPLEVCKL
jgi:hypothetical protein